MPHRLQSKRPPSNPTASRPTTPQEDSLNNLSKIPLRIKSGLALAETSPSASQPKRRRKKVKNDSAPPLSRPLLDLLTLGWMGGFFGSIKSFVRLWRHAAR